MHLGLFGRRLDQLMAEVDAVHPPHDRLLRVGDDAHVTVLVHEALLVLKPLHELRVVLSLLSCETGDTTELGIASAQLANKTVLAWPRLALLGGRLDEPIS